MEKFWFVLGSVACLFFASCNNVKSEGTEDVLDNVEEVSDSINQKLLTADSPEMVAYLTLQKAFVSSDADSVRQAAEVMLGSIVAHEEERTLVTEIVEATDVADQRVAFEKISNLMISRLDTNNAEGLFYQHCPMAFDNEGASWISDKERIANPYFGDEMLRCGFNKKIY